MLRYTTYFLPILFFYQALIGEKGSTLIDQDLESLEQSAEKGNPYAEGFLALCYLHGDKGLNISHSDAQYFAKKSANQGHWLGEFVLGFSIVRRLLVLMKSDWLSTTFRFFEKRMVL